LTAPLLAAQGVCHRFGELAALEDVEAAVAPGELCVVVGPNGAGKTTLLRVLAGLLKPDDGSVRLRGSPLDSLSRREIARSVAVAAQEPSLPFPYTVAEVVGMGRAPFLGPFGRESGVDREIVLEALARTGLALLAERRFPTLSSGERQRVILARAFAQTPCVMLLDEPTAHMDLGHRVKTFEDLRAWVAGSPGDRAALVVTHDLILAARYADRMTLLDRGRCVSHGTPREVLDPARIAEVYGVEVSVLDDEEGRPVLVAHRSRIAYTPRPDGSDR
jgi:iron complex transport system ATP-binding protein